MRFAWFSRIRAILTKELQQLGRDRLTFALIAGMPILQLLMFGYAINTDVRNLRTGIADQAQTHLSRQLLDAVSQSQVSNITLELESAAQLEEALRRGEIVMGVLIPPDFDKRIARGDRNAAQLLVDGSDPTVFGVARQLSRLPLGFDTARTARRTADIFEVRSFYNPERRTPVNIVPGLLGVILTMTMVMFTAVAVVKERENGNLEFLINTPLKNAELMAGKIIPYILIGLIQVTLLLVMGSVLFDVPIRGTLIDLYLASLLFIMANLSLGLLISTATETQFQAMQMTFFILLPSILLSGFMFPFDGMPALAQSIAEILPMTHFLRLVRGVMLRDASLLEMPQEILALAVFFAVTITLATLRFRKRLD